MRLQNKIKVFLRNTLLEEAKVKKTVDAPGLSHLFSNNWPKHRPKTYATWLVLVYFVIGKAVFVLN
jgi:hypothetical protein